MRRHKNTMGGGDRARGGPEQVHKVTDGVIYRHLDKAAARLGISEDRAKAARVERNEEGLRQVEIQRADATRKVVAASSDRTCSRAAAASSSLSPLSSRLQLPV